jgi:outer membrane lipoprotein-sorting protein
MCFSRARSWALFLLTIVAITGTTGCLARRRVITRQGGTATELLLKTSKDALLKVVADRYAAIRTLNMTVDMVPALGSVNRGKVTEYKDVRAYILFRKPADIRLIGLYPVVRNKAFDMVSNGDTFRLYIPAKSRFIEGKNELTVRSTNKLENLRPQHFLEALLVKPVTEDGARVAMVNLTDEENAAYILSTVDPTPTGVRISRQIWFNRVNLNLVRQITFDPNGDILSDARYTDWQEYDDIRFPKHIEVNRPQDDYGVVLTVVKMEANKPLTDDKFVLERPEGTTLQLLGTPETKPEGTKPQ